MSGLQIKPGYKPAYDDGTVVFRTARRRWHCCGGHDGARCTPCNDPIEQGSSYVEYLGETPLYQSGQRYHFECALQQGLVIEIGIVEAAK